LERVGDKIRKWEGSTSYRATAPGSCLWLRPCSPPTRLKPRSSRLSPTCTPNTGAGRPAACTAWVPATGLMPRSMRPAGAELMSGHLRWARRHSGEKVPGTRCSTRQELVDGPQQRSACEDIRWRLLACRGLRVDFLSTTPPVCFYRLFTRSRQLPRLRPVSIDT
jgi:hypothetical protein